MRRRFFVDAFDDKSATLRGAAAEHLGRVLRATPGQLYELSDGNSVWLSRIESVALSKRGENRIEFSLIEAIPAHEPLLEMHLLISVVKFDRFEWCLEKATELGVKEIVPLAAARTDKPLAAAAAKRHARWEKILLESAQQSRRLRPPALRAVTRSDDAFLHAHAPCKILLSERPDARTIREALHGVVRAKSAALAIGPEGGWMDDEIAAARAAGFLEASLGEIILRTETAVLAGLTILNFALSDS